MARLVALGLATLGSMQPLGLRVEHQAQPACTLLAGLRQCGHVRNVIETLRGNDSDSAALLSAHYDNLLLGSAAFASSTLFDKVRVVANFEARGSRGVSALVGRCP